MASAQRTEHDAPIIPHTDLYESCTQWGFCVHQDSCLSQHTFSKHNNEGLRRKAAIIHHRRIINIFAPWWEGSAQKFGKNRAVTRLEKNKTKPWQSALSLLWDEPSMYLGYMNRCQQKASCWIKSFPSRSSTASAPVNGAFVSAVRIY